MEEDRGTNLEPNINNNDDNNDSEAHNDCISDDHSDSDGGRHSALSAEDSSGESSPSEDEGNMMREISDLCRDGRRSVERLEDAVSV